MELVDGNLIADLQGPDGNAFSIMGTICHIMSKVAEKEDLKLYRKKATSGDYNNLLRVTKEFLETHGLEFIDKSNLYPDILGEVEVEVVVRKK